MSISLILIPVTRLTAVISQLVDTPSAVAVIVAVPGVLFSALTVAEVLSIPETLTVPEAFDDHPTNRLESSNQFALFGVIVAVMIAVCLSS